MWAWNLHWDIIRGCPWRVGIAAAVALIGVSCSLSKFPQRFPRVGLGPGDGTGGSSATLSNAVRSSSPQCLASEFWLIIIFTTTNGGRRRICVPFVSRVRLRLRLWVPPRMAPSHAWMESRVLVISAAARLRGSESAMWVLCDNNHAACLRSRGLVEGRFRCSGLFASPLVQPRGGALVLAHRDRIALS